MNNTTADKVLAALQSFKLRKDGTDQYRANRPWSVGSDSLGLTLKIDDGEHGCYDDKVSGESGSLYELATKLGIELPVNGSTPETTSKRAYADLADYAQAHGVKPEVYSKAGWEKITYQERPCLRYPVTDASGKQWFRYRFIDGDSNEKRFTSQTGFSPCWYGLDRAIKDNPPALVLCNGAASVVVAQHYGVPAAAQEGGENPLSESNLAELQSKWSGAIYICLEDDEKGNKTAGKWLEQLPHAKRVDMKLDGSQDLADFCTLYLESSLSELRKRATELPTDEVSIPIQVLARQTLKGRVIKTGLFSHINALDEALGTFRPHRIHTILGATGMGKSTLAVSISMAFLWQAPGLWVTTETPPEIWFDRMVAYAARVPIEKIIEGTCSAQELKRVREKQELLEPSLSRIYDGGSPDVDSIVTWVKRWQQQLPIQWLMIDSISRLKTSSKNGIYDTTTKVSNTLQDLARTTGLVVVGTSQIGRKMDGRASKIPTIHDGKGSGSIEEDADIVIPLYYHHYYVSRNMIDMKDTRQRDLTEQYPAGKALLYVGKHRYRYVGNEHIPLRFKGGIGFFNWQEAEAVPEQNPMPIAVGKDTVF
jgi:energy-coupling factor transporter ATP-binding protein EcfA2